MRVSNLVLAVVLSFGIPLAGQAEGIIFRALAVQDPITGVFFKSGGKRNDLEIPAYALSKPYNYGGDRTLDIYRVDPGDPLKKAELKVASILFPEHGMRFMIIFSEESPNVYSCKVISDDPQDFPNGALRFYNGTDSVAVMRYDQKDIVQITPHGIQVLNISPGNRFMQAASQTPGGWHRFYSGFINNPAEVRRNLLIIPGAKIHKIHQDDVTPRLVELLIVDSEVVTETEKPLAASSSSR